MTTDETFTRNEFHRKMAAECFNRTWDYIEKADRTPEEIEEMIHMSHASRYHWAQIGTVVNRARGDWQLSRVYAITGNAERARHYAESCLRLCRENGIGDFDLAYAYEAMARSAALAGRQEECLHYRRLAEQAGEQIAGQHDKDLLFNDLATIASASD